MGTTGMCAWGPPPQAVPVNQQRGARRGPHTEPAFSSKQSRTENLEGFFH